MHEPGSSRQHGIGLRTLVAILILLGGSGILTMRYLHKPDTTTDHSSPAPDFSDAQSPMLLFATPPPSHNEPSPTAALSPTPASVVVYISGSVRYPDTYRLPKGARIKDVVTAAGGLTDQADQSRVNLAEYIHDAQHIHIPAIGETAAPPASGPSAPAHSSQAPGSHPATPLNINTASQQELEQLSGIGSVLAGRIIEYRTANGSFTSIEELSNIQGISPSLVEKISDSITVRP